MKAFLSKIDPTELTLNDKLIRTNRVAKVMKGGKRLSFSALVVTGDGKGHVGLALGKANEVPVAISKASATARKNLIKVSLVGTTIPYKVVVKFGAAEVMFKPASPGTGIVAGGSIRAVLEAAGVRDVLTKSLGSTNAINVAKATMLALSRLKEPAEEIARRKVVAAKAATEGKSVAPVTAAGGGS